MKRILIAYDDDSSRPALERGADLAEAFGADLAVISVTPWRGGRFPTDPWDDVDVHSDALKSARNRLTQRGLSADFLSPTGDPGKTIATVVRIGDYDTVVVGSRGLGRVARLMQGSISEYLATNAEATVVIAR